MEHNMAKLASAGSSHSIEVYNYNKAYGLGQNLNKPYGSKALGADPARAQWLEQAHAYKNAVLSGDPSTPKPDPQQWNEFLRELQWAETQEMGGGNMLDPNGGMGAPGGQQPQTNDFGGEVGPGGFFNYDSMQSTTGFTGDKTRNNIFGTDNTQNFDQPSAKVSFEMTKDHGVDVLKEIVTTSKGTAVYIYDDYNNLDFKLGLNIADPTKVTGLDSLPADIKAKITVAKFDPKAKGPSSDPQSNVTGQPVDGKKNEFYYEATSADDTIEFHPKPGENETHYVAGNLNLSLGISDHAKVWKGPFSINGDTFDYLIKVQHKDGSVDIIYTKKPFTTNINAVQGYTSFDGKPATDNTVPDAFNKEITLNGGVTPDAIPGAGGVDDPQTVIDSLETATGKTDAQLLKALTGAGFDGYEFKTDADIKKGMDKLRAAIKSGDFPGDTSVDANGKFIDTNNGKKFANFLETIDPDLKDLFNNIKSVSTAKDFIDEYKKMLDIFAKGTGSNVSTDYKGDNKTFTGSITIDGKEVCRISW